MKKIAEVQRAHPSAQGDELRALLSAAYPFGERKYHPYRTWLDCVNKVCRRRRKPQEKPIDELPLFRNN